MKKYKYLHWLELGEGKHYLSIGKKAPWLNEICIRVPRFVAKFFNHKF